jgi:hypothetical protein
MNRRELLRFNVSRIGRNRREIGSIYFPCQLRFYLIRHINSVAILCSDAITDEPLSWTVDLKDALEQVEYLHELLSETLDEIKQANIPCL